MLSVKTNYSSINQRANGDYYKKTNSRQFSPANIFKNRINQKTCCDSLNLSFKGASHVKEFTHLLDKIVAKQIDDEEAAKLTYKLIPEILSFCKKEMGRGCSGKVVKINENYVLKQSLYEPFQNSKDVKIFPDKTFDDLKTWFGARIIGDADENFSILKNANTKGEFKEKGFFVTNQASKIDFEETIHNFSQLPIEAFDKVAKDFKTLNLKEKLLSIYNYHYYFDFLNPSNFLFSKSEIRIVDGIDFIYNQDVNSTSAMVSGFVTRNGVSPDGHCQFAKFDENLKKPRFEILKKSILACENNELPFADKHKAYPMNDLSLKLCGIKKTAFTFGEELASIRNKYPDMKERNSALENYLENIS